MPSTLGLDDDLEPAELVLNLEDIFEVSLSPEAQEIANVGQLYDVLLKKIPQNDLAKKCASAMAFYRIRRGLRDLGHGDAFAPSTDMRLLEPGRTKANLSRLSDHTGLRMPRSVPTQLAWFTVLAGFAASLGVAFAFHLTPIPALLVGVLAGVVFAIAIFALDAGQLPPELRTLGSLSKAVAAANFGRLAKLGAHHSAKDIWEALLDALPRDRLQRSEITRETVFTAKAGRPSTR